MAPYLTEATICAPGFKTRRQLLKMLHGTPIKIQSTENLELTLTGIIHDDAWFEPGKIKIENIRAIELAGEQEIKIEDKWDLTYYISTKELSVVGA